MMKYFVLIILLICAFSCKKRDGLTKKNQELKIEVKDEPSITLSKINEFHISDSIQKIHIKHEKFGCIFIEGLNKLDFLVDERADSIFIIKQGYEGFEKAKIKFSSEKKEKVIKGKIIYGVSQYTLDDNVGVNFLNFSFIDSVSISINKNKKIPIGNHIKGYKKLDSIFNKIFFKQIRDESYDYQIDFYKNVIKESSKYEKCCPEYITKAKKFVNREKKSFKKISELSLEPLYKKIFLDLNKNITLVFLTEDSGVSN